MEGYSNLLYVLLITPGFFLMKDSDIYLYASAINIASVLITFLVFSSYARTVSRQYALGAGILFVLYPPNWVWSVSGMETSVALLLHVGIWVTTAYSVSEHPSKYSALLLPTLIAMSVLVRADGFIVPIIAILYLVLKGKYRLAVYCGAVLTLTILGQTLWRYSYYRDFLPNTYYAKVSGPLLSRLDYAWQLLLFISIFHGMIPYLYTFLVRAGFEFKALFHGLGRFRQAVTFETLCIGVWLAYWAYIGGDVYYERFLLILVPVGIIALLRVLETCTSKTVGLIILSLLLVMQVGTIAKDPRFSYSFDKYDCWITLGQYLAEHHDGESLAIGAAGKAPYFSNLNTIDMFGLNNAYIAHQPPGPFVVGHTKIAPDYVLAQRPDLIAGWIMGLDLDAGITEEKYRQAGYRLRYLVFMGPVLEDREAILDVTNLDSSTIQELTQQGYGYAVLARVDAH